MDQFRNLLIVAERKVRRKRGHVRCFCYLPSEERQKTTQKREKKDVCSLQCDKGGCRGLTVYFRGH